MPKGRPRKNGPRDAGGRLLRSVVQLPPAFEQPGLAVSPADYVDMEVTERGQVVGRTIRRCGVIDVLAGKIDGDRLMALRSYEAARDAVAHPVRCALDQTPCGGGGIEAFHDSLRAAGARLGWLSNAMPPHVAGRLNEALARRCELSVPRDLPWLEVAADCLIVALSTRRAA